MEVRVEVGSGTVEVRVANGEVNAGMEVGWKAEVKCWMCNTG